MREYCVRSQKKTHETKATEHDEFIKVTSTKLDKLSLYIKYTIKMSNNFMMNLRQKF